MLVDVVTTAANRRRSLRYPIAEQLRFRTMDKTATAGSGMIVNIGSSGVLFRTEHALPLGRKVQVDLDWPALLDGETPLKLVATGIVARLTPGAMAVRFLSHEFRTRRRG